MRVLFGTVFFPATEAFLNEFLDSIVQQDYEEFNILIINDGLKQSDIWEMLPEQIIRKTTIIDNIDGASPSELRVKILSFAKDNDYDLLIFGDSDDTFSFNRVTCIVRAYNNSKATFLYNNLVREDGNSIFESIPYSLMTYEDIGEYNYVGLSMAAVSVNDISEVFIDSLYEYKGVVFDWYFFSRLLLENKHGLFVADAMTYYRIHQNNYVGIAIGNEESISREIVIKQMLYLLLSKYSSYYKDLYNAYKEGRYIVTNSTHNYWWGLTRRAKENEF